MCKREEEEEKKKDWSLFQFPNMFNHYTRPHNSPLDFYIRPRLCFWWGFLHGGRSRLLESTTAAANSNKPHCSLSFFFHHPLLVIAQTHLAFINNSNQSAV